MLWGLDGRSSSCCGSCGGGGSDAGLLHNVHLKDNNQEATSYNTCLNGSI